MKKSIIIIIVLAIIFSISGLIVAGSPDNSSEKEKSPCIEAPKECCYKKKPATSPGGMIWETFPHKFMSFIPLIR